MFSLISQLSHVEIVTPRLEAIATVFHRSDGLAGDCTYAIIDLSPRVAKFLSS